MGIMYLDTKDNFSFKCHRDDKGQGRQGPDIYSVNDIAVHPTEGTFATVGADGKCMFWDKEAKNRLKMYDRTQTGPQSGVPITSCEFNAQGDALAYGIGYDWSKGSQFQQQYQQCNFIAVKSVKRTDYGRK